MLKKSNVSYELISFKLYDGYVEREVDDNESYKSITNNYCYPFFIEYLKKIPIIISSNYYYLKNQN